MTSRRVHTWVGAGALLVGAVVVAAPASFAAGGSSRAASSAGVVVDDVRINEIQVVGSHNSYKRMVSPAEEALRRSVIGAAADQMAYQHEPLGVQFQNQKVRQIELDVFADSQGGKYANPLLRSSAGVGPYDPAMNQPGIKVLHIQDVDYGSTCLALVDCLGAIEQWSDANPKHLPIAVLVELKDAPLSFGDLTFTTPEPWTATAMDNLDAEIRSVMDPEDLIVPDDVRGSEATLEDAVTSTGWPTVEDSRGKVMFLMDNGGSYRTNYLAGHPSLQDRVLFTNASPGSADAAFVKRNDPRAADISSLVDAGYMVRTRSDADTLQARTNDTSDRDVALASGAQWVSTDYPVPGLAFGFTSPFFVEIPGGTVARCNPINGPSSCVDLEIEDLSLPKVVPGAASVVEGDVGTTTLEVPVTLSKASDATVTASWSTGVAGGAPSGQATPGSDYVAASGTITFSPGQTSTTIAITVKGDTVREPDEYVIVFVNSPTNAVMGGFYGLGFGGISDDDAVISIVPGSASVAEGNAGTTTVAVPVVLDKPSLKTITVQWATGVAATGPAGQATPGVDYTPASGTVTFAPGQTTASVPVSVKGDAVAEPDEYLVVFFTNPTNARLGGFWGLGFGRILNDD